ncbi:Na+/H+ antiporter subunit D [Pseudomonas sp. gcc21]|uniref:proton-conducting transporter transmembrane domain-containing protein n=1 Tax=Pseudomonas sp. gcc21 TaxID=2726989 RepID=UPI001451ADAE|nr:proton-conducting transporter membrane subunit [Pseudomonas sp. gcc21]QJD58883.1 Na+/H+ antiporter subunit D [Pseudomonas sp. gcc21]
MNLLLVLPVLLPLTTLMLCLLVRRRLAWVTLISLAGSTLLLITGLWLVWIAAQGTVITGQMGSWPAPYGISLVIDRLSAVMVAITGVIGLATLVYMHRQPMAQEFLRDSHLFTQGLLTGICGAFITGDVFNLYVWFEVLLMGSFALISLGGGQRRLAGSMTYLVLNLLATLLFLLAAGLVYGASGTLNMGELALIFRSGEASGSATLGVTLMLLAFSIKGALFPVFGWLPASYHVAWVPVSALFAGLLTKVGVYALIRLVTLLWPEQGVAHEVLLWVACATMLVGVLGAAAQTEIRRILSFHIVSQVGYMVLGLALATPLALAGAVFYLIHHIVVKANLFLIGGLASRFTGSERLARMGGLYAAKPLLAVLFAIPALSLAGIPPLSGFWAKLILIRASLEAGQGWAASFALLTGAITVLSMSKIWNEAFLKPHPDGDHCEHADQAPRSAWVVVAVLALMTVLIGFGAGPAMEYAWAASLQLTEAQAYLQRPATEGAP